MKLLLLVLLIVSFSLCEEAIDHLIEKYDEDGDGLISLHEFEVLFKATLSRDTHGHAHEEEEGHEEEIVLESMAHSEHADEPEHVDCYGPDEIFTRYDINNDTLLSAEELSDSSAPMILNVINRCRIVEPPKCKESSTAVKWVSGIVAAIIISLISLVILVFIPLNAERMKIFIMVPMVSFAIGALLGDAIFHLIPEALGAHSHEAEGEEEPNEKAYLGPMALVLIAILLFYLIERQLTGHSHIHPQHSPENSVDMNTSSTELQSKTEDKDATFIVTSGLFLNLRGIKPYGYLSLAADALHNFTDGLAIGAAFSISFSSGLATSLAVILHEIPQELGDFAILIRAGFSKRNAVLFNLGTAFTAVLGVFIGLGVGNASASKYILAFTAGGFLYVALTDMMAELHHEKGFRNTLVQLGFIVLGLFIMVILALWLEEFSFC